MDQPTSQVHYYVRRRRRGVSTDPVSFSDIELFKPTSQDALLHRDEFRKLTMMDKLSVVFGSLSPKQQEAVMQTFQLVELRRGETLISQGQDNDRFVLVLSGRLDMYSELAAGATLEWMRRVPAGALPVGAEEAAGGGLVNSIGPGEFFGETSLMYQTNAPWTVKAGANSELWTLTRRAYQATIIAMNTKDRKDLELFYRQIPSLSFGERRRWLFVLRGPELGGCGLPCDSSDSHLFTLLFSQPRARIGDLPGRNLLWLIDATERAAYDSYTRISHQGRILTQRLCFVMEGTLFVTRQSGDGTVDIGTQPLGSMLSTISTNASIPSIGSASEYLQPSREPLESFEIVRKVTSSDWFVVVEPEDQSPAGSEFDMALKSEADLRATQRDVEGVHRGDSVTMSVRTGESFLSLCSSVHSDASTELVAASVSANHILRGGEKAGLGLATLESSCLLLSVDVKSFQRVLGPVGNYVID